LPEKQISLCLSGGGFRATLFHLGVIQALRDLDLLKRVNAIYSISGGSIIAAHLVLNWERYTASDEDVFRGAARELIAFMRLDVRGRIVRRWLFLGWLRRYNRVEQLIRYYNRLFKGAVLETLQAKHRPQLQILATSLISGDVCAFNADGFIRNLTTESRVVMAPELTVGTAVAASSAFPPLFPPVELDPKRLGVSGGELLAVERLTDGGVFDNVGVRAATLDKSDATIFASDASAEFTQDASESYLDLVTRTMRTTDILMSRVAHLEQQALSTLTGGFYVASITKTVSASEMPRRLAAEPFEVQEKSIQKWVKYVRTDLDAFTDTEIRAIYRHGLEVGRSTGKALLPAATPYVVNTSFDWDPCSTASAMDDSFNQLQRSHAKLVALLSRPHGVKVSDARTPDTRVVERLKAAKTVRFRLWSARDPFSWLTLLLLIATAASLPWMIRHLVMVLKRLL
jgi:predicted acylesterase/phospholipase RssA